jgi:hypothetical protein
LQAIDYLLSAGTTSSLFNEPSALLSAEFSVEALHFGLALSYHGVLNEPRTVHDLTALRHQFFIKALKH